MQAPTNIERKACPAAGGLRGGGGQMILVSALLAKRGAEEASRQRDLPDSSATVR
jgi:hypothetical protein